MLPLQVHESNDYGFGQALAYRVWNSHRYRVRDPAVADLFLVPVLPVPKRGRELDAACRSLSAEVVAAALAPHFTEDTAHKHVFVLSKEHYEARSCKGW